MSLDLLRAMEFAVKAHGAQTRKGSTTPYVLHPVRVAHEAAGQYPIAPEAFVIAALLHDVVEDTSRTLAEIEGAFGPLVAQWVGEVTNQFTKEAYPDWNRAKRKACEIARLSRVSREAQILKMLDRLDNLNDLEGMDPGFVRTYVEESRQLAEALWHGDPGLGATLRNACEAALDRLGQTDSVSSPA